MPIPGVIEYFYPYLIHFSCQKDYFVNLTMTFSNSPVYGKWFFTVYLLLTGVPLSIPISNVSESENVETTAKMFRWILKDEQKHHQEFSKILAEG